MKLKLLLSLLIIGLSLTAYSKKKPLIQGKEAVVEAATKELAEAMNPPEGELYLFQVEYNIKGEFVMDIGIQHKGLVSSVFCAGSEGADIKTQNLIKDFIKQYEFQFKLPKGHKYKFQYIFKFE